MDASRKRKAHEAASLTDSLFGDQQLSKSTNLFASPSLFDKKIQASRLLSHEQPTDSERANTTNENSSEAVLLNRKKSSLRKSIAKCLELKRDSSDGSDDQIFAEDISSSLKASGVVLVRNVIDPMVLTNVAEVASAYRSRICEELKKRGRTWNHTSNNNTTVRFWEVAVRCHGRMDARYPTTEDAAPFWESHTVLQRTVENILYGGQEEVVRPRLVYAGFIFSEPGSVDQPWHQDGVPLFPNTTLTGMLPPYAINVFIPLESADLETGPTEFVVGSHHGSTDIKEGADERIVSLLPEKGDIVMYDYRICHRGTSNLSSDRVRTVLYLMYARPWFNEHVNFGTERLLVDTTEVAGETHKSTG